MPILDLRQVSVRQIDRLLEEEARHWRDELHWDYRGAIELIKRFLDAHALAGAVALENGQPVGYSFYVLEDQKGLIGGLYVSPRHSQQAVGCKLLDEVLFSLRALPHVSRIEAQLMPFGGPVEESLRQQGFRLYKRQFMLLKLDSARQEPRATKGYGSYEHGSQAGPRTRRRPRKGRYILLSKFC